MAVMGLLSAPLAVPDLVWRSGYGEFSLGREGDMAFCVEFFFSGFKKGSREGRRSEYDRIGFRGRDASR